ncbi:hypothetical protein CYPRO_3179 [Cyclonatronum proteinivorum]|uniref:Uncharacterized protein n=1 Tax=Cyclonatronum proteinivorum TaxID=1457365 RepID=A0A345UPL1_9BACT|nr:hypothetical protein [Cyclonatronum proteinivorum]AXJ02413.1 hypothetical protein CYPRO_3179 [Cyclonatronum proteinivorum]
MEILPVVAAVELESAWLLIGFFVFVAVCAAAAMLILLKQHNYGLPPNSTQAIMLVMLLVTMLISLLVAAGLYRLSSELRDQSPPPAIESPQSHALPGTEPQTSTSLTAETE